MRISVCRSQLDMEDGDSIEVKIEQVPNPITTLFLAPTG